MVVVSTLAQALCAAFELCIHVPLVCDEDITSPDMTLLVAFDSKVERFFIRSKFNTFDELMLHHDVCSISFVEVMDYKALTGLSLL
jgi:hypothetical protein